MIEPSLELRFSNSQTALSALRKSGTEINNGEGLAINREEVLIKVGQTNNFYKRSTLSKKTISPKIAKPGNSRITVNTSDKKLTLIIPCENYEKIFFWISMGVLPFLLLILIIPYLFFQIIILITAIIYTIIISIDTKFFVEIDSTQIICFKEFGNFSFNIDYKSSPRQDIYKLEVMPIYYRDEEGGWIEHTYQIIIWAGKTKYEIKDMSRPEIDWIASELSEWLDLPITHPNTPLD